LRKTPEKRKLEQVESSNRKNTRIFSVVPFGAGCGARRRLAPIASLIGGGAAAVGLTQLAAPEPGKKSTSLNGASVEQANFQSRFFRVEPQFIAMS
jgi:hypothetical protein